MPTLRWEHAVMCVTVTKMTATEWTFEAKAWVDQKRCTAAS